MVSICARLPIRFLRAAAARASFEGSIAYPRRCTVPSGRGSTRAVSSIAETSAIPAFFAASRASSVPRASSWSAIAIVVRPEDAASRASSPGPTVPSDTVEWRWRSTVTCWAAAA